jgi:hypothetical protein
MRFTLCLLACCSSYSGGTSTPSPAPTYAPDAGTDAALAQDTGASSRGSLPWSTYQAYLDNYAAGRPKNLAPMQGMDGVSVDANGTWIVDAPTRSIVIENRIFRPTAGHYALEIRNQRSAGIEVEVRNCYFVGGTAKEEGNSSLSSNTTVPSRNGYGIHIVDSNNVRVHDNWMENLERVAFDVVSVTPGPLRMDKVTIYKNRALNMQAHDVTNDAPAHPDWPIKWESKFIQFFNVIGDGNMAWDNRILNQPGWSFTTDFINLYQSSGVGSAESERLRIVGNKVIGPGAFKNGSSQDTGSYHLQGAGIQLGDHAADTSGGQYVEATSNVLVFPGRAGVNINGGVYMTMKDNTVLMADSLFGFDMNCSQTTTCAGTPRMTSLAPWTAVSVHNYSGTSGNGLLNSGHQVSGNRVDCPTCSGGPTFLPADVNVAAQSDNVWNATLSATTIAPPAEFFTKP